MAAHLKRPPGPKRLFDIVFAIFALVVSLPVLAVGALWILVDDGWPILFSQERAGFRGRHFTIHKLRTLRVNEVDPRLVGQVDGSNPLVTRSGRVLRRLRIDELPQLVNVIRGEMSVVGPRPTLVSVAEDYSESERKRLEVRPGLTGWAQVNGNTQLDWADRILLDSWYVDHWSLGLDLRIIVQTLLVVLRSESVNHLALEKARAYASSPRRSG